MIGARALHVGLLACLSGAGCNLWVSGDFDGVPYLPSTSVLAIADRHDLLVRDGAAMPVLKNRAGQRLHLVLTDARVDPGADWLRFPHAQLLDLQRELATRDGLLIKGLSLDHFGDGETLGVNVEYSVEELPLGTAGSVRLASGKLDETFVVNLSSPTNAIIADGQGVRTIMDDEPRIGISDVTKREGRKNTTLLPTDTAPTFHHGYLPSQRMNSATNSADAT